jgi:hypothetical protein
MPHPEHPEPLSPLPSVWAPSTGLFGCRSHCSPYSAVARSVRQGSGWPDKQGGPESGASAAEFFVGEAWIGRYFVVAAGRMPLRYL